MDNQQQQRIQAAAQQFTDALVASYRASSDRTVVAQQLGAQQIEYFFDTVINNLRTQAEGNLQTTQQLASQQQRVQEATRELTQASTDNYMDLLDSVFAFYQGGTSRTRRRAEEAQRRIEQAEVRAEEAKRSAGESQRRAKEAEESAKAAQRRAEEAERSAEEAKGRTQEAERSAEEAQRRALEAERRAEEAERSRSEAADQVGDEAGDANADAARHPLNKWVRTSGRSKVRGRNTRSRRGSSRR